MIIKFLKAEIYDPAKEGGFLSVLAECGGRSYKLSTPRRIRQKISNFYGECLDLPVYTQPVRIKVSYSPEGNEQFSKTFAEFKFQASQYVQKQLYMGSLTYQKQNNLLIKKKNKNQSFDPTEHIRFYIGWQLDTPFTRKSSQCSRDFFNIQTPKKQHNLSDLERQWRQEMRLYSPDNKRSYRHSFHQQQLLSKKGDSSPQKTFSKKYLSDEQQQFFPKNLKSKSMATRSKTPSKKQLQNLKLSLPLSYKRKSDSELEKQKEETLVSKTFHEYFNSVRQEQKEPTILERKEKLKKALAIQNKFEKYEKAKFHPQYTNMKKRKNSHIVAINKVGALLAGTVGVLAGLLASYAAPY